MSARILSKVKPVWDYEYRTLDYENESFNDPLAVKMWLAQGYPDKFTGDMCDMRKYQPPWTKLIANIFERNLGWKDIGTSFYRMNTGTVLPPHKDTYKRYIELFDLQGKEHTIKRAIIFLEDWESGHYLEVNGNPYVNWNAGDVASWNYGVEHMAANIGLYPRFTLQLTGHL